MSKLFLFFASLIICYSSFGQFPQSHCIAGTGQFDIISNNYRARVLADNDMFWDFTASVPRFEIPINSNSYPIFAAAPWMGGYVNGLLHMGAMTYRQNGVDFWPGPIDTASLGADITDCQAYDMFFPITKAEVTNQKNHLYNSSNMPADIKNWPGNRIAGDNTSYKLAPYQDVNHNNTYDPLNGDYPIMYGDYSVYQITNDVGNKHGESGGRIMGIETHITNYAIACADDSALRNTLFLHYDLINRGVDTLTDFLFSMWSSFGYGAASPSNSNLKQNYIGCDTSLNMYYCYKGTGYDSDIGGTTGYHQYLPAFAGVLLNQKLSRFISYKNNTSNINGNPSYGYQGIPYYNLMNGVWENGTPMTYGDSGTTASNSTTKYMYSGDPVANIGWTEANAGNKPGDRNGLGTCGPFTFYPKDTLKIDFAYVFARDYQHPGDSLACIPILRQYIQSIQNYYNTNTTPCGSTFGSGIKQVTAINNQVSIYPNPNNGSFVIEPNSTTKQTMQVYDVNGKLVVSQTINGKTTIDASNLNVGVYNISLQSNEGLVNKRLVIVR